jgi:hypothetical protein
MLPTPQARRQKITRKEIDQAVCNAYGLKSTLSKEESLEWRLSLNVEKNTKDVDLRIR